MTIQALEKNPQEVGRTTHDSFRKRQFEVLLVQAVCKFFLSIEHNLPEDVSSFLSDLSCFHMTLIILRTH